jgi:hypothetical protein
MGGGGSSGPSVIPFDMSKLAPLMPSVFQGPFNAQGALQNEETLAKKYPWITPPAGQFAGAQPGQFAGATTGNQFGFPGSNVPAVPPPNPPIPPTVPSQGASQYNPMGMAPNQVNAAMPSSLQQILAVLGAQSPTTGGQ